MEEVNRIADIAEMRVYEIAHRRVGHYHLAQEYQDLANEMEKGIPEEEVLTCTFSRNGELRW